MKYTAEFINTATREVITRTFDVGKDEDAYDAAAQYSLDLMTEFDGVGFLVESDPRRGAE